MNTRTSQQTRAVSITEGRRTSNYHTQRLTPAVSEQAVTVIGSMFLYAQICLKAANEALGNAETAVEREIEIALSKYYPASVIRRAKRQALSTTRKIERNRRITDIQKAREERERHKAAIDFAMAQLATENYEPTETEIQQVMEQFENPSGQGLLAFAHERSQFACDLETARTMFMKYPDLVQAVEFPPEHLRALRNFHDNDQHQPDSTLLNDNFLHKTEAELREEAILLLRVHKKPDLPSGMTKEEAIALAQQSA